MMSTLNQTGYTQNFFPFSQSQLEQLKEIATEASNLTTEEQKNIFELFPIVKSFFDEAIKKSEFNLKLTQYCFFIEKSTHRNWPLLFHRDINLPKYMNIFEAEKENFLNNAVMFRLTLDSSNKDTGALKVIPYSHLGNTQSTKEVFIDTEEGEVIFFKPLLLHGSNRMKGNHQRRVFQALCIMN